MVYRVDLPRTWMALGRKRRLGGDGMHGTAVNQDVQTESSDDWSFGHPGTSAMAQMVRAANSDFLRGDSR
ncbi:MAG TPA: hypothetical protein VHZ09_11765 [Acidobacteriaceae bacterium]|jgi:hypothetical protein|nr:hypothetical protein [Acidobacteriaceae bacterium]